MDALSDMTAAINELVTGTMDTEKEYWEALENARTGLMQLDRPPGMGALKRSVHHCEMIMVVH